MWVFKVVVVDYVELMVESFEADVNLYLVNNQHLIKGVVLLVLVKTIMGRDGVMWKSWKIMKNKKTCGNSTLVGVENCKGTSMNLGFDEQMTMFKPSLCALRTW
jgi:hypothetical protein